MPNFLGRVGTDIAALSTAATEVFLDETTTSGIHHALTASGSATSEGELSLSVDGRDLMFAGYDAAAGTANVVASNSIAVPRVVGRAGINGSVDTSTALTDVASAGNMRGAVSSNGIDIWTFASTGGIHNAQFGATTST